MVRNFPFQDLAHVIQLAVAPVFLLTSLGTMLSVFSLRLARIVDRIRVLAERLESANAERRAKMHRELNVLLRRRRLINLAITCGTISALIVCVLIALAFLGYILSAHVGLVVATLFIAAMFAFVLALVLFLSEVLFAAAKMRHELS